MSYTTIATQIVVLLNEIDEISVVFDHEPNGELGQFPAATVKSLGHENIFNDTAANKRKYSHRIRCYYRSDDAAQAETMLRSLADLIITKFESNFRINNTCDYSSPTIGKFFGGDREVPTAYVEIYIDAYKRQLR